MLKKGMSLALAVSVMGTNHIASAASAIGDEKIKAKEAAAVQELALQEAIRESDELAKKYPNGLFNFLGTQFEINEEEDYLEICIIRQGGTNGEASVRFKAIDITSSYGEDYKIYTSKEKNSPIKKGEDAFPLIETAYTQELDLSVKQNTEDMINAAVDNYVKEEQVSSVQSLGNSLDQYPNAAEATATGSKGTEKSITNVSETQKPISLKALKEADTGVKSDREDWKVVADSGKAAMIRENYELFFDSVGGTETTLTFQDGEYVKYLYLFPEDDKKAEAEEQLICTLLPAQENAPVGDSYHSYVNIVDNEEVEESVYEFENTEVLAEEEKAVVTINRTAGQGYYDTIYIGTAEGSANPDADYTAGLQQVDFYAGQTSQTVSVDILENEYRNASRDFYVLISRDGEEFLKSACHVTIPANSSKMSRAAAAESSTAEKISENGFRPSGKTGQWGVPSADMSRSSNKIGLFGSNKIWTSGNEMRYQHIGGTYKTTSNNVQLYGVKEMEFGYWSTGSGRSWQTHEYYYKNGWNKFWGKKTWYWQDHNEKNYGLQLNIGSKRKWSSYGYKSWDIAKASLSSNKEWSQGFSISSWAGAGNSANVSVGWVRLYLKDYNYSCEKPANAFVLNTYEPSISGNTTKLTKTGSKDITPTLSLKSVSSNVGNSTNSPNNNTKLYRSDALVFQLKNYQTNYLTFQGIEVSVDNKNWKKVSSNLNIVLNADFFSKFDLHKNDRIYFRPVFQQNNASVKFLLDTETKTYQRGTYTNVTENYSTTLHAGDTIKNIQGQSGNTAAYQPIFYLNKTKGRNAFSQAAKNTSLTLDSGNSAGAVAILKLDSAYNEVKLAYANPTVTVQADPNTYRHTYTNLSYKVGTKTYDCSKIADIEALHKDMEEKYQKNIDANITISFEYLANPEYKNGKGNQAQEFGTPKYALLNVYDVNGEPVKDSPYRLNAGTTRRNGKTVYTFTKSGNWKSLGWEDGTTATITFYGSKIVAGNTITSEETEIEFLNTSAGSAMVMDQNSNILKDSKGDSISTVSNNLVFKSLNPLSTYHFIGMPSNSFITRWADYSLDINSDGNASIEEVNAAKQRLEALGQDAALVKSFQVYYGNKFSYQPSTYSQSKLYYDFVKRDTSTGNSNVVGVQLTKLSSTVLEPDLVIEEPLTDALVTFAGTSTVSGDKDGCYADKGNYQKGDSYLADVKYENMNFQVAVQGTTYQEASINVTEVMFPTDFSVTVDGKETDVKTNGNSSFVKIENKNTQFSFNFKSSVGVKPKKAKVTIYDLDGNRVLEETLTRNNISEMFTWNINPLKAGVKPGCQMKIQGIYTDTDGDHIYPAVEVGLVFQAAFTIINVAASFQTPLSQPLKLFGQINTKFDLPLDYDLDERANLSEYKDEDTGAKVQTRQIAFGYNSDVMKELKDLQTEHRAENKGNAASGRDNVKRYLESLMEDDDDDDDDDDVDKEKDKADNAQNEDTAGSSSAGESSFNYDFSVALVLTVESGIKNKKPDGQNYFDSLVLIASGEAEFDYTVVYTTPIGIDILAEMGVSGKAVVAFGVESSNAYKYADIFNLTKNGSEKGKFQLNKDYFSLYTKFLLAPTITVGAGVGVGAGMVSVTVSGTAAFNFGFDVPIMGDNVTSAGSGSVTLSADLKIKVLFIKKKWTLYKTQSLDLFSYGTRSVAEMLNDFEENYLYDDISLDTEIISRDYLKNRSKWQPHDISARKVEAGSEVLLEKGVYPYPQTKLIDLGNGRLLMVYVDDRGETGSGTYVRDSYNRSELLYTLSQDHGATWSEPSPVDNDGTWDEAPDAFLIKEDKVLVTWSDASRVYTEKDTAADTLTMLDISGAWFDVNTMTMGEPFAITKTTEEDRFSDVNPMISYDEATERLMVYYTKVDYGESVFEHNSYPGEIEGGQQDIQDVTTYGDLVNGYNLIAYRYAEWKDGEFVWNESSDDESLYGQRFLDLAIPAVIKEQEVTVEIGTYPSTDENDNVTQMPITEKRIQRELELTNIGDPRIIDSDLISYNGLALYAYTMDFDQNLETTDDQQLYIQIYNYATDEFHYPIQITSDGSNSMPQFVRCKNMTYLYWIHNGDIQYLNITQVVRSLNDNSSYLKLKAIQTENGIINMYILDKYENDPVATAIEHEKEIAEDGTVTENAISDFDIQSNGNSMYILWTAMTTSEKEEEQSGADNVIRETQIFGAYCEPEIELVETEELVRFEDVENVIKYTFVEGKDNTTYPLSATLLSDTVNDEGEIVTAGAVVTYAYDKVEDTSENENLVEVEDVNGNKGLVKAGDPAIRLNKKITFVSGSDWSKPIQITTDTGANYTDLSFRITGENEIQAVFAKGTQSRNENGCFEEDEDTKSLYVQTFNITSTLKTGDIVTDKDKYYPGDKAEFSIDVTNDGLKPLNNITYRTYAKQNGEVIEGSETEWLPLAETARVNTIFNTSASSDMQERQVEDTTQEKRENQFLGGNTILINGSAILGETIEGTVFTVEVRDENGTVVREEKELTAEAELDMEVKHVKLLDKNTAELAISISNNGNKDYQGDVCVTYQDKNIAVEKGTAIPYGEKVHLVLLADITDCSYGKLMTNEDGSKQDVIDLKVVCGDVEKDTQVIRSTTAEAGYASEAVTSFEIGASSAYDEEAEAKPVKDTLNIKAEEVMSLESLFTIDSAGDAAKKLAQSGLSADAMMTTVWESSDPSIAYISDKGILVPMKDGTVEVTAKVYPKSDSHSAVASVSAGTSSDDEEDFGQLIPSDQTGYSISEDLLYTVPKDLVKTKTIKVNIGSKSANNNGNNNISINNNTGNKNNTDDDDKKSDTEPEDNNNDTKDPDNNDNSDPNITEEPNTEDKDDTEDNTTIKKKKIKTMKVIINKKRTKVTVKTIKKAAITVKVYKTKKLAKANKKKGRIRTYKVKASKNKKGKVVIKLRKKLKKNQAVRVIVTKSGYKSKTVVKKK